MPFAVQQDQTLADQGFYWVSARFEPLHPVQELFQKADKDRDGKLTFSELRQILWEGSKEYSHLAEHARFLDGCDLRLRASH